MPGTVPERGNRHIGPEPAAVLTHPPALHRYQAIGHGIGEFPVRDGRLALFGRVEHRKVLPDDLVRLIALHPLGTFVPGGNDPVRAEGKYGVLGGPLDEQLESICGVERSVRADRFIGKRRPNPGPSLDVSTG